MKIAKQIGLLALLTGCGGEPETPKSTFPLDQYEIFEENSSEDTNNGDVRAKPDQNTPLKVVNFPKPCVEVDLSDNLINVIMDDYRTGCVSLFSKDDEGKLTDDEKFAKRDNYAITALHIYVDGEIRRTNKVQKPEPVIATNIEALMDPGYHKVSVKAYNKDRHWNEDSIRVYAYEDLVVAAESVDNDKIQPSVRFNVQTPAQGVVRNLELTVEDTHSGVKQVIVTKEELKHLKENEFEKVYDKTFLNVQDSITINVPMSNDRAKYTVWTEDHNGNVKKVDETYSRNKL